MGYIVHHTIVVSSWDIKLLRRTWKKAKELFSSTEHHVSNITPVAVNGERSYFIAPDGSKRGWDASVRGWEARKEFVEYLKTLKPHQPGWVLVQFDDDEHNTKVIDSSDHYNPNVNYLEDWAGRVPQPEPHYD